MMLVPLWYHLVWWMLSPVLLPSPCPDHPYCSPRSFWFSQTTLLWGKSLCCCGCKFSRAYDRFATVPKKLLKTLKFWKSLNSLYDPGSRPQKSPKIAQKRITHSIAVCYPQKVRPCHKMISPVFCQDVRTRRAQYTLRGYDFLNFEKKYLKNVTQGKQLSLQESE